MFKFWGKVKTYARRGKTLGFPTANIDLHKNIPEGIYISQTKVEGKIHPSLTFIGKARTFIWQLADNCKEKKNPGE